MSSALGASPGTEGGGGRGSAWTTSAAPAPPSEARQASSTCPGTGGAACGSYSSFGLRGALGLAGFLLTLGILDPFLRHAEATVNSAASNMKRSTVGCFNRRYCESGVNRDYVGDPPPVATLIRKRKSCG